MYCKNLFMENQLHNLPRLIGKRKKLRNDGTKAEAVFWNLIKHRKINGLKFRRQHSVGSYILDFYCPEIRLAIELDGHYHYTPDGKERDMRRDNYLKLQGITVIRFENNFVFKNPTDIYEAIQAYHCEFLKEKRK